MQICKRKYVIEIFYVIKESEKFYDMFFLYQKIKKVNGIIWFVLEGLKIKSFIEEKEFFRLDREEEFIICFFVLCGQNFIYCLYIWVKVELFFLF